LVEQLCSERKVLRYVRGLPVRRFERKPGAKAEALDCLVYAFAARQGVTIHADTREDELRQLGGAETHAARHQVGLNGELNLKGGHSTQ
jgi:phage terminase large subunit GpA-like protein